MYKLSKSERAKSLHDKEIDETIATTSLSHLKRTNVAKKDFAKEVRAERDIKSFIDNSEVLLDLPEVHSIALKDLGVNEKDSCDFLKLVNI